MSRIQHNLFACGNAGLPEVITCRDEQWHLKSIFKHDFFACTGLYASPLTGKKCVLKFSRIQPFFGIGMGWLGRFLRNREMKILRHLEGIDQFPKILMPFGRNGLVYHFIEGRSLDEKPVIPDNYFYQLRQLLEKMHRQNVCYMDMNKKGNIIVGADDRPYLIDFQISLLLSGKWCGFLRRKFQHEDIYHFLKHKRHYRPDLMNAEEMAGSRRKSKMIHLHRIIGIPFRKVRRSILRYLYKKQILNVDQTTNRSPENDHTRFTK